jgi:hypothetical protein
MCRVIPNEYCGVLSSVDETHDHSATATLMFIPFQFLDRSQACDDLGGTGTLTRCSVIADFEGLSLFDDTSVFKGTNVIIDVRAAFNGVFAGTCGRSGFSDPFRLAVLNFRDTIGTSLVDAVDDFQNSTSGADFKVGSMSALLTNSVFATKL